MKVTILGSGTSTGVPEIGCQCEVCVSNDAHDKRLRTSALVEVNDVRILIDCGPDFREQMMHLPFRQVDGVLITHEHYDHVGGIDDLRPFCRFGEISIYAEESTSERLKTRMPYCFAENRYPGVPRVNLVKITDGVPFFVKGVEITPLRVMHGLLPILGYRMGDMAYITDMKTMPEESRRYLSGVKCLVVNALRHEPHPAHQSVEEALEFVSGVNPSETYFIHMCHHIGLHREVEKTLPRHVHLAYDGLVISVPGIFTV